MLCTITCRRAKCAAQQCSVCVYFIYLPLHVESEMLIIANFTRQFKSNRSVRYSGCFFFLCEMYGFYFYLLAVHNFIIFFYLKRPLF